MKPIAQIIRVDVALRRRVQLRGLVLSLVQSVGLVTSEGSFSWRVCIVSLSMFYEGEAGLPTSLALKP